MGRKGWVGLVTSVGRVTQVQRDSEGPRAGLGTRSVEGMEQAGWLLHSRIRKGLILDRGNNSSGQKLGVDSATQGAMLSNKGEMRTGPQMEGQAGGVTLVRMVTGPPTSQKVRKASPSLGVMRDEKR